MKHYVEHKVLIDKWHEDISKKDHFFAILSDFDLRWSHKIKKEAKLKMPLHFFV